MPSEGVSLVHSVGPPHSAFITHHSALRPEDGGVEPRAQSAPSRFRRATGPPRRHLPLKQRTASRFRQSERKKEETPLGLLHPSFFPPSSLDSADGSGVEPRTSCDAPSA